MAFPLLIFCLTHRKDLRRQKLCDDLYSITGLLMWLTTLSLVQIQSLHSEIFLQMYERPLFLLSPFIAVCVRESHCGVWLG